MLFLVIDPIIAFSAVWALEIELTRVSQMSSVCINFLFLRRQLLNNLILNDKDNMFISVL